MNILRKRRRLRDIESGSVIFLENEEDSSNKKEFAYLVCDSCNIDDNLRLSKDINTNDIVMLANLYNGYTDYYDADLEVEVVDASVILDY